MKKTVFLLLAVLAFIGAKANDGVFYASGNQLIPISETDISVKKEVLNITRVGDHLEVTVYYEFFNPSKPKDLLVGFEAEPPYPYFDEDLSVYPEQPHMRNFTVLVNGECLSYEVTTAMYPESNEMTGYYKNGKFSNLTKKQAEQSIKEHDKMFYPYFFVYHFNAHFKEGQNIVVHTYDYDLSNSVAEEYSFPYVLTAANRWANHQIDDFTLTINMGDRESFAIKPTFFKSVDEWTINGVGRTSPGTSLTMNEPLFHIQQGGITFHKKNFHPEGEIDLTKKDMPFETMFGDVDREEVMNLVKLQYATWRTYGFEKNNMMTKEDARIMRNLPFAYRGFVFKTKRLQQFFESTNWYVPNPDYVDKLEELSQNEREWIEFWSK